MYADCDSGCECDSDSSCDEGKLLGGHYTMATGCWPPMLPHGMELPRSEWPALHHSTPLFTPHFSHHFSHTTVEQESLDATPHRPIPNPQRLPDFVTLVPFYALPPHAGDWYLYKLQTGPVVHAPPTTDHARLAAHHPPTDHAPPTTDHARCCVDAPCSPQVHSPAAVSLARSLVSALPPFRRHCLSICRPYIRQHDNQVLTKYYTGITKHIPRRFKQHNSPGKKKRATRRRFQWRFLAIVTGFATRSQAMSFESEVSQPGGGYAGHVAKLRRRLQASTHKPQSGLLFVWPERLEPAVEHAWWATR